MDIGSEVIHYVYGYGQVLECSADKTRVMFAGHSMYVKQEDLTEVK